MFLNRDFNWSGVYEPPLKTNGYSQIETMSDLLKLPVDDKRLSKHRRPTADYKPPTVKQQTSNHQVTNVQPYVLFPSALCSTPTRCISKPPDFARSIRQRVRRHLVQGPHQQLLVTFGLSWLLQCPSLQVQHLSFFLLFAHLLLLCESTSTFSPDFTFAYGPDFSPSNNRFDTLDCHFDAVPCVPLDSPHRRCNLPESLHFVAAAMPNIYFFFKELLIPQNGCQLRRCSIIMWHQTVVSPLMIHV